MNIQLKVSLPTYKKSYYFQFKKYIFFTSNFYIKVSWHCFKFYNLILQKRAKFYSESYVFYLKLLYQGQLTKLQILQFNPTENGKIYLESYVLCVPRHTKYTLKILTRNISGLLKYKEILFNFSLLSLFLPNYRTNFDQIDGFYSS